MNTASRLDRYIAPARTGHHWTRVLAGMVIIAVAWIGGTILITGMIATWEAARTGDPDAGTAALDQLVAGGSPGGILVVLATFLGIWGGIWLVLTALHNQRFWSIFGPRGVGGFGRGLATGFGFAAASVLATIAFVGAPMPALSVPEWLPYAIPGAVLVFFQATGEELIFRGYLLQQLAVRFRSPLIWGVFPAFVFGLLHFSPNLPDGGGYFYVAITTLTGAALAVTVWRTGALWAAAGIHVGINLSAILFVGTEGILSGTQLWVFPAEQLAGIFWIDLLASALLLAFVISPAGKWLAPDHQEHAEG